ncbi:hypothetical protein BSKO_08833 [Bryopsis sp. KO-2023]|nr:hypothetical protein BSKO_08833 [Bryopsis sp. KO-2023]
MKRTAGDTIKRDEKAVDSMHSGSREDSQERCKIPRTQDSQSPSRSTAEVKNTTPDMLASSPPSMVATATGLPLGPRAVNDPKSGPETSEPMQVDYQPSAKEIAAAKAARIRLGLEEDDGTLQAVETAPPGLPSGTEPSKEVDCEYVETAHLKPLADPAATLQGIFDALASKNWVEQFKSLNITRQLIVHHTSLCRPELERLMAGVLKLAKSPRSSISKTAVMCCCNLFETFGDEVIPWIDIGGPTKPANSMVSQLLLKAGSNDKQFVVEEVQRSLTAMAKCLSPISIIEMLVPYTKHRSPKVRGKAAVYLTVSTEEMDGDSVQEFKLERLLGIAGGLIKDNTPDARDSAKKLVNLIHSVFCVGADTKEHDENGNVGEVNTGEEGDEGDVPKKTPWEEFCYTNLDALTAAAIVKSLK